MIEDVIDAMKDLREAHGRATSSIQGAMKTNEGTSGVPRFHEESVMRTSGIGGVGGVGAIAGGVGYDEGRAGANSAALHRA